MQGIGAIIKGLWTTPPAHAGTSFTFDQKRCIRSFIHLFRDGRRPGALLCNERKIPFCEPPRSRGQVSHPYLHAFRLGSWDNTTRPRKAGLGLYHRRPAEAVGLGAQCWEFCKTAGPGSPAQSPRPEGKSEASGYAGNRQAPAAINHRSSDRHLTQNPAISHPKSFWILFLLLVPESLMQVLGMALGADIQN
jgi:hypothetical protein